MSYNKFPAGKIPKIVRWLKRNSKNMTVNEAKAALEQKFTVGVFMHYGRIKGQVHTFEVWTKMREHWLNVLVQIEVPVEQFKPEADGRY